MTEGGGGFRVEPAGPADLQRIAQLAAAGLREAWSTDGFAGTLGSAAGLALVARRAAPGAPALGYLVATVAADELHVLSLAVDPAHRRGGVARALVGAVVARGRERGARAAHLEVRAGNGAARALYGGLGFRVVGRRRRYYADGEDALLLRCELAPPGSP